MVNMFVMLEVALPTLASKSPSNVKWKLSASKRGQTYTELHKITSACSTNTAIGGW